MIDIEAILKKYWNYDRFRPLQKEIILSVLEGKDTLALLPTGGGKSVCFQVPALALDGICIVVSPLIALMKDQVEQLHKKGIEAVAIFSGMGKREIDIALDNCAYGKIKFLYVSPERLQTELLQERAKKMKISLLAIDEAHCISQWGYDFRPPYLEIANFRQLFPQVPCLALTATATPEVQADIQEKLQFPKPNVFQKSFARPNLSYSVFRLENKEKKLIEILQKVKGSAVVYAQTRLRTKQISDLLNKNGINSDFYHAGLPFEERSRKQNDWIQNKKRVMVATNAFGMGIDKPDVRVVVHIDLPQTLEAYYQEAGRAGRDEKMAYAVALYHPSDLTDLRKKIAQNYPETDFIKTIYQRLANFYSMAVGSYQFAEVDFDFQRFCQTYQLKTIETYNSIKQLEQQGFIQLNETFFQPSKLHFICNQSELYAFQIAHVNLDHFIKTLLRTYGGELFQQFVRISESQLATLLKTDVQSITKYLDYLQKSNIVVYTSQKDQPQLIFSTERFRTEDLPWNQKDYESRQERDTQKVEAVVGYLENTRFCRTLQLLAYFGEISDQACGVCDVCLAKKKAEKENKNLYKELILKHLAEKRYMLTDLVEKINPASRPELIEQIRQMVEAGDIFYTKSGELEKRK